MEMREGKKRDEEATVVRVDIGGDVMLHTRMIISLTLMYIREA